MAEIDDNEKRTAKLERVIGLGNPERPTEQFGAIHCEGLEEDPVPTACHSAASMHDKHVIRTFLDDQLFFANFSHPNTCS